MAIDTTPIVDRLELVILLARDMERSAAFYRDLLGIPLEGDGQWQEARFGGGAGFALHPWFEDGGAKEPSSGTIHVNLAVADFDAAAARLRESGAEVHETMREEWGIAGYLLDPDGYRVYLFQPPA
ncbi:MAG: VOC family protein [Actinomycetota bacterium]|nr:VOC family protein [Actinomycetota bacterium]